MIETQLVSARWGRGRWLAVGLLLASGAGGAPALAQGTRAPAAGVKCASVQAALRAPATVDAEEEVVKLYDEGVKAANTGQWEKARTALLDAFNRIPHCKIAANLGWAELMTGNPRDAAEHLSLFLRKAQNVSATDRQKTEKMLAQAKAAIGTVTVQVEAKGADVLVDGQKVGTSPLAEPVFVEPGSRTFEARKAELSKGRQVIEVAAGAELVVEIRTAEKAAPPMSPRLTPGPATPSPESGSPRSKALTYAGIGVSAGLAAVAIGTAIGAVLTETETESLAAFNDGSCTKTPQPCADTYNARNNRRYYLSNTAFWASLGAGVLGGATAIYALTGKERASKSTAKAALLVSPQGGGIVVAGSF